MKQNIMKQKYPFKIKKKITLTPVTKVCVLCQKVIGDKEEYFKVTLFSGGKDKGTDYAHKVCWMEKINLDRNVKDLIKIATQFAQKQGAVLQ
jgi:hypothetical protein